MNLHLDQNYNIKIPQGDIYHDDLDEIIDLVIKRREEDKLTEEETSFLLKFALNRAIKNDVHSFFDSILGKEQKTEKYTMFMQLKTKIRHAS